VPGRREKFYDLGHGYCTYDFFDQCPRRMACAKCSFYMPKGSTTAAPLEGKNTLSRIRLEICHGISIGVNRQTSNPRNVF
jgi:hypothetical protein